MYSIRLLINVITILDLVINPLQLYALLKDDIMPASMGCKKAVVFGGKNSTRKLVIVVWAGDCYNLYVTLVHAANSSSVMSGR